LSLSFRSAKVDARRGASVLRTAVNFFLEDRARRLSASLAYYTIFTFVPILSLALAIAAAFMGSDVAAGEFDGQLTAIFGSSTADKLQSMLVALWDSNQSWNFAIFGVSVAVFSASVLFVAWRDVLELIWDVPYESGLRRKLSTRAVGALVPVIAGLLLTLTMVLHAAVSFVQELLWTDALLNAVLRTTASAVQTALGVLTLALLYRYSVRSDRPTWRQVLPSCVFVSVVFAVGFFIFGIYLRTIGTTSLTGAASSVVLGLVVVYYAIQSLLLGAEIIKVRRLGNI
jgi:membrane protein